MQILIFILHNCYSKAKIILTMPKLDPNHKNLNYVQLLIFEEKR